LFEAADTPKAIKRHRRDVRAKRRAARPIE
jgi:hypothetical protein